MERPPKLCPKCGADYTNDPNGTANLKKHLARKTPCVLPTWEDMVMPTDLPVSKYVSNLPVMFYDAVKALNPAPCYSKHASRQRWLVRTATETKGVGLTAFTEMWINLLLDNFPDNHPQRQKFDEWLQGNNIYTFPEPRTDMSLPKNTQTKQGFQPFSVDKLTKLTKEEKQIFEGEYKEAIWSDTQDWLKGKNILNQ